MHVYQLVSQDLEENMKMVIVLIASIPSRLLQDKRKTSKAVLRIHSWLLPPQVSN